MPTKAKPRSATPTARPRPPALGDRSLFVVRRRVPILDVHDHPTKGKVDVDLLDLLARNSNARAARGSYGLTLIGHTTDDGPETGQPPLVGYLKDYVVGEFDGRPCLLSDFYFNKSDFETAMTYPHRSVERVESDDEDSNYIDAVALMRRAPERPLSLLTHRRDVPGVRVVRYARDLPAIGPVGKSNPRPAEAQRMTPDLAGGDDLRSMMREVMKEVMTEVLTGMVSQGHEDAGGPDEGLDDLPPDPEVSPGLPGDEEEEFDDAPPGLDATSDAEDDDEDAEGDDLAAADLEGRAAQDDAAAEGDEEEGEDEDELGPRRYAESAPTASNDYSPTMAKGGCKAAPGKKIAVGPKVKKGTSRMARSEGGSEVVRYRRAVADLEATVAARDVELAEERRKSAMVVKRYERDRIRRGKLESLVDDGYSLDVDEELKDTADHDKARFAGHLEKIRTRYGRIPIGKPRVRLAKSGQGGDPAADMTPEDQEKVVRYAREQADLGVDHRTAVEAAMAKFNTRFATS